MLDLQKELTQCLYAFVSDIRDLAKRSAAEAVERAFVGARTPPVRRPPGRPRGTEQPKRSRAELDRLASRFLACVEVEPGLRIEQINQRLGTQTKDLALPIRELIARGQVTTKGAKRSTVYFVPKLEGSAATESAKNPSRRSGRSP